MHASHHDSLGNAVSLADPDSLGALNDFVEGFIASEARVAMCLQLADTDHSPMVQACCAALHMFAESRDAPGNARPFIEAARRSPCGHAARAAIRGGRGRPGSMATCRARSRCTRSRRASTRATWPRSSSGSTTCSTSVHSPGMLRMALAGPAAAADVPYLHGMAGLRLGAMPPAGAGRSCARHAHGDPPAPKEPWAHHALAHVMLTQGRITRGPPSWSEVSDQWTDLNSFMVTHNWWHQALF
jgi:hypothetical protein